MLLPSAMIQKPPAESRAMNQKCSLLDFYDKHDIWHMLSAFGMFFTFLVRAIAKLKFGLKPKNIINDLFCFSLQFVLVIDDGVANWERKKLKIF